ncbi:MAG TPA: diguanylate cyclase [Firmicutes bacterium]|nr:diguanylate cyclase [Bacillota bacterium]
MRRVKNPFSLRLTIIYIILSSVYIVLSDRLLAAVVTDPGSLQTWQTYKGWVFVLVSGILFYITLSAAVKLRIRSENSLKQANEKLQAIIAASPLAILTLDTENRILSWNQAAEKMFGWKESEVLGCLNPTVSNAKVLEYRSYLKKAADGELDKAVETELQKKDGSLLAAGLSLSPIRNNSGEIGGYVVLISDITEQKLREKQLQYMSLYDGLTGIYNRAYFEHEMRRLQNSRLSSLGVIVCDLDGLKLYNDSLGHAVGDKLLKAAAQVIRSCFRESDVVARIGGDEFAILIPNADSQAMEAACERIRLALQDYNQKHEKYYLSVSVGYAVSTEEAFNVDDLFREADNNMYREKARRSNAVRETTMQILLRALAAREYTDGKNAEQVEQMVAGLAAKTGITGEHLKDIQLLARFHDIGTVGVPEKILFKTEPLTSKEREIIKRHPEIGHRIALSAPDLIHLADWILKHHEWWNGKGYPLGLKGSDIPLECRILAIVDAYDALTNDRPYRKAKSKAEALAELKAAAGIQFDPELVKIFIDLVTGGEYQNMPQSNERTFSPARGI